MNQALKERFYQATKYKDWDKNTKIVAKRVFTTIVKNFSKHLQLLEPMWLLATCLQGRLANHIIALASI